MGADPLGPGADAPHLSLGHEERCLGCHALEERDFETAKREFESAYAGYDPSAISAGDFQPMLAARCATCHTDEAAGDSCASCHNYHWGDFVPVYLSDGAADRAAAR